MQIQPACGSQLDVVGRQKGTPILGPVVMDTDGSSARAAALHLLMYAIETGLCVAVHELHANAVRDPKPKSKPEPQTSKRTGGPSERATLKRTGKEGGLEFPIRQKRVALEAMQRYLPCLAARPTRLPHLT